MRTLPSQPSPTYDPSLPVTWGRIPMFISIMRKRTPTKLHYYHIRTLSRYRRMITLSWLWRLGIYMEVLPSSYISSWGGRKHAILITVLLGTLGSFIPWRTTILGPATTSTSTSASMRRKIMLLSRLIWPITFKLSTSLRLFSAHRRNVI